MRLLVPSSVTLAGETARVIVGTSKTRTEILSIPQSSVQLTTKSRLEAVKLRVRALEALVKVEVR